MFCPDKENLKWPDSINYTNVTLCSLLLWLLWLLERSDLCPQTNPLWENVFVLTWAGQPAGRPGSPGCLLMRGAVIHGTSVITPPHPPPPPLVESAVSRELGKPQGRQFVVVEVNIAKWVVKSLGCCEYGKSRNSKPQLRKMFTYKQCSRIIFP